MRHPERVEDYLEHIAQASERAIAYVQPFGGVEALRHNQQVQDAVIRNIETVGEAATRIEKHAPAFVTAHPELPWIEGRPKEGRTGGTRPPAEASARATRRTNHCTERGSGVC